MKKYFLFLLIFLFNFIYPSNVPEMYFCTASDALFFPILLNLIGSIHRVNFEETIQIAVFDLGLTKDQKKELARIEKVKVYQIELIHPDLLKPIKVKPWGKLVPGDYAWKPVVIKQALDIFPYILYLDAGITVLNRLDNVFKHIVQNGYFLLDCGHDIKWMTTKFVIEKFNLHSPERRWILNKNTWGLSAGFQGLTHALYDDYVMPMYELSKDLRYFADDGSTPDGFGTGRHDQTLFSIYAQLLGLTIARKDNGEGRLTELSVDSKKINVHFADAHNRVRKISLVYFSRIHLLNQGLYKNCIHYKA